jgi:hypothetical protein
MLIKMTQINTFDFRYRILFKENVMEFRTFHLDNVFK